jgi:hypothetical protein
MMKTLYLVSCVSKKEEYATEARDIYISPWFKKARAYVEKVGSEWFILSARYGLLEPTQVIAPYDETLKFMPRRERKKWADAVLYDLGGEVSRGYTVIFLAGISYREFLAEPLKQMGVKVQVPMEGLSIGKQNQWLKRKLAG